MNTSYQYILQSVINKNDFVRDADNTLDTKVGVLLAVIVGVITLSFTLTNFETLSLHKERILIAGFILAVISFLILFWIQSPKDYKNVIGGKETIEKYLQIDQDTLILHLISDAQYSFTENNKTLSRKVFWYRVSLDPLITSFILLLLTIAPADIIKL